MCDCDTRVHPGIACGGEACHCHDDVASPNEAEPSNEMPTIHATDLRFTPIDFRYEPEQDSPSDLNREQRARVEALHQARMIIPSTERAVPLTANRTTTPPTVRQMVSLSDYILTGEYAEYTDGEG